MRGFFRRISPKRAALDFAEQWRQPTPHRWQIMGVAIAATFAIFMLFIPDSQRAAPARPEITYITTLDENRSDEEIMASNIENQARKDAAEARAEEVAERKKDMYRALGRATFIDVDEMEAEIEAERAVEESAEAKADIAAE